ncbi:MAG: hypothetical protein LBN43_02970, partial [Oscillospiraceae bacterium]|nr:hypothetical protein [Oscillospiraceae bacterium]
MKYYYEPCGSFTFVTSGALRNPAWSNILTNGKLGCIVTDRFSGNMWYDNAREFRVTPWLNDPDAKFGPERLSISGMSLFAADDRIPCKVTFGFGFARWEKAGVKTTVWINPNADTRVITVEKRGYFTVDYSGEFVIGADKCDAKLVTVNYDNDTIRIKSLNSDAPEFTLTSDCVTEFTGESGLTNRAAARFSATDKLTILSGFGKPELCTLDVVRSYWRQSVNTLLGAGAESRTFAWLTYQTLASRIMGRCSLYQSGGAYGFRDQLQDVCMLIDTHSRFTREHILLCAAHQYEQGDVQHWWHAPRHGVRTRCSDDLLWLVWA